MIDVSLQKKIKTVEELGPIVRQLKGKGKIVVHCHGVFDLVHLGHIRYFHAAKREGDVLIVTLTADRYVKRGPGRPIFNEHLRAENIAALGAADYVAIAQEPTALHSIKTIRPNIYAKGPDYMDKQKDITGMIDAEENMVKKVGGKLFITDDITFSSSQLLNTHFDTFSPATRQYVRQFAARTGIDDILKYIHQARKLKVLIIGESIIDQYQYCSPLGVTGKEALIVHRYHNTESFAGGALATANNTASIVHKVNLLSVLGEKGSAEKMILTHLVPGVRPKFYYRPDSGTIVKKRFVSTQGNRKLFALYDIADDPISPALEKQIAGYLEKRLPRYDLVIVNDFGHGLLTDKLIRLICQRSKKLAINVQTNSANMGFNLVTKYRRADFICIDEKELRFATHDRLGNIKPLIKKIHATLRAHTIITTRGPQGSLSYNTKTGFLATPALASQVIDAIGAGDAFFAFTAPLYAVNTPLAILSFIGNAVGALAVQIVGNREPVKYVDLVKFMTRLLK